MTKPRRATPRLQDAVRIGRRNGGNITVDTLFPCFQGVDLGRMTGENLAVDTALL